MIHSKMRVHAWCLQFPLGSLFIMTRKRAAPVSEGAGPSTSSKKPSKPPGGSKPAATREKGKAVKGTRPEREDYPEPEESLFDAVLNLSATIAANAAALYGNTGLQSLLVRWRAYAEKELSETGRVQVQVLASFLEGVELGADEPQAALTGVSEGREAAESSEQGKSDGERRAAKVQVRIKRIGDMMGGRAARGHNCLNDVASGPQPAMAHRTLSVEDATLFILDSYAKSQNAALQGTEDAAAGESSAQEQGEGKEVGGGLPSNWTAQFDQWDKEKVPWREQVERFGKAVTGCLAGLPVFVMENGGTYYSLTHLKYVLGLEKKPYELFRILREENRATRDPEEALDAETLDDHNAQLSGKLMAAGPGMGRAKDCGEADVEQSGDGRGLWRKPSPERGQGSERRDVMQRMQLAVSGLATGSPEGLAGAIVSNAVARSEDPCDSVAIACSQLAALQDSATVERFRAAAAKLLGDIAAQAPEPPEELFLEVRRRFEEGKQRMAEERAAATGKGKEKVGSEAGEEGEEEVGSEASGEVASEWNLSDACYVDEPDPEEAGDECAPGLDWEAWHYDRPGFNPSAPVPIRSLGEISRFWMEFAIPGQVVVMQQNYNEEWEKKFLGRHNLWTFKVLSNIMPMSRFLPSAPSSETFIAVDLAKSALQSLGPQSGFGDSLAITATLLGSGVPLGEDAIVHAQGSHLLALARAAACGAGGFGAPAVEGEAGEEPLPPGLRELHAKSLVVGGHNAQADVMKAAAAREKEDLERGAAP